MEKSEALKQIAVLSKEINHRSRCLTTAEFIEKAKEKHSDKYDYSLVNYSCYTSKVDIICKTHGVFKQTPSNHLGGHGCLKCAHDAAKLTTIGFVEKAKEKHGDEYDYSLVEYYDANSKVNIICKTHGVFKQKPALHLYGSGCQKCANEKINDNKKNRLNTKRFIKKAREVHGNEFDYSLVDYKDSKTKVKIICRVHGVFEQLQYSHLSMGYGCKKCFLEKHTKNKIKD